MRTLLGVVILLAQVGAVVYAHASGPRRYFAWAPNDYAVKYSITTVLHGRRLRPAEVLSRYGYPQQGLFEDPAQRLIDYVDRFEETYGRDDHAAVVIRYSIDGHAERTCRRG